jgi:hypothetical protein
MSEAAHGTKGCSDNSHWRCFLRLFRGIRVSHRTRRGPHQQPARMYAKNSERVGVVVAMSRAAFTSRVVALGHPTRLLGGTFPTPTHVTCVGKAALSSKADVASTPAGLSPFMYRAQPSRPQRHRVGEHLFRLSCRTGGEVELKPYTV